MGQNLQSYEKTEWDELKFVKHQIFVILNKKIIY